MKTMNDLEMFAIKHEKIFGDFITKIVLGDIKLLIEDIDDEKIVNKMMDTIEECEEIIQKRKY